MIETNNIPVLNNRSNNPNTIIPVNKGINIFQKLLI